MTSDDELLKKASSAKVVLKSMIKRKNHLGGSKHIAFPTEQWNLASLKASLNAQAILDSYQVLDGHEFYEFIETNPPDGLTIQRLIDLALRKIHPDKASQNAKKKAGKFDALKLEVLTEWEQIKGTGKSAHAFSMHKANALKKAADAAPTGTTTIIVKAGTIEKWIVEKNKS